MSRKEVPRPGLVKLAVESEYSAAALPYTRFRGEARYDSDAEVRSSEDLLHDCDQRRRQLERDAAKESGQPDSVALRELL
jgi:hypothetical protein